MFRSLTIITLMILAAPCVAQSPTPDATVALGLELENYDYPFPVAFLPLTVDGHSLHMAYMDVAATTAPNGEAVVLLHGKNFFGAYWRDTITALSEKGYRVVVPDQLGFGKSSKEEIHYSFHLMAANTKALLDELKIEKASIVGHSMGGMVATRFALQYPNTTGKLVLVNPIGLEDYRPGVEWTPIEKTTEREAKQDEDSIRKYFSSYVPKWKPEYDEWMLPQIRWTKNNSFAKLARINALTYEMIYQQPVVYEFPDITVPTLLLIGQEDRTVVGKGNLKDSAKDSFGNYPALGKAAHDAIKGSVLVEIPSVGHLPQLEDPARFQAELLKFLGAP